MKNELNFNRLVHFIVLDCSCCGSAVALDQTLKSSLRHYTQAVKPIEMTYNLGRNYVSKCLTLDLNHNVRYLRIDLIKYLE